MSSPFTLIHYLIETTMNKDIHDKIQSYMLVITIIAQTFLNDPTPLARGMRWCLMGALASMAITTVMVDGLIIGMQDATKKQLRMLYGDIMICAKPPYELHEHAIQEWLTHSGPSNQTYTTMTRYQGYCVISNQRATSGLSTIYYVGNMHDPLIQGNTQNPMPSTQRAENSLSIMVGIRLAKKMHLEIGDHIDLSYTLQTNIAEYIRHQKNMDIHSHSGVITNMVCTGLDEIDEHAIIVHNCPENSLFLSEYEDDTIEKQIYVYSNQPCTKDIQQRLHHALEGHACITTWPDMLPGLASGMELEKKATQSVLALIWMVILITFAALSILMLLRKKQLIILLRLYQIPRTLLIVSLMYTLGKLSLVSMISGSIIAYIASFILTYFQVIHLPDCYYQAYITITPSITSSCMLVISLIIMLWCLIYMYIRHIYTQELCSQLTDDGML
jgi:ABC-type lipoprotein release transport system permease subunit